MYWRAWVNSKSYVLNGRGEFGVHAINTLVETVLSKQFPFIKEGSPLYPGLKILITRNDTSTGLFNGDMGVLLETQRGLQAFFPNHARSFAIPQLPEWEQANAMTIHKSQGSEICPYHDDFTFQIERQNHSRTDLYWSNQGKG